jgi:hypothetical protein
MDAVFCGTVHVIALGGRRFFVGGALLQLRGRISVTKPITLEKNMLTHTRRQQATRVVNCRTIFES